MSVGLNASIRLSSQQQALWLITCFGCNWLGHCCADALKENKKRWRTVRAHGTAVGLPSDAGESPCRPGLFSYAHVMHLTASCRKMVRLHANS